MKKNIAYCGLSCGDCPAHMATINDDDEIRGKIAFEWSNEDIKLERGDINCLGCRSDETVICFAKACLTRACAIERGVEYCILCDNYICEKLEPVFRTSPEAKENLEKIKEELCGKNE